MPERPGLQIARKASLSICRRAPQIRRAVRRLPWWQTGRSALLSTADIVRPPSDVCFVLKGGKSSASLKACTRNTAFRRASFNRRPSGRPKPRDNGRTPNGQIPTRHRECAPRRRAVYRSVLSPPRAISAMRSTGFPAICRECDQVASASRGTTLTNQGESRHKFGP